MKDLIEKINYELRIANEAIENLELEDYAFTKTYTYFVKYRRVLKRSLKKYATLERKCKKWNVTIE